MASVTGIENTTAHRPWPCPSRRWVMFQSWQDLAFLHWPLPARELRPLVPRELSVEEFGGSAWLGLTPFVVRELHPRRLPPIPLLSDFAELNLRTYVRVRDKPGVFFLSLDAGSALAVAGARTWFRLPYRAAQMRVSRRGDWIRYFSRRYFRAAEFVARYRPIAAPAHAGSGTLEHFLAERYALYTVLPNGRILRGEIHHRPWLLAPAEAEIALNTVPRAAGVVLPERAPIVHFSQRQDTLIWPPALEQTG